MTLFSCLLGCMTWHWLWRQSEFLMSDSFHLKTEVNSPDPKKWKILAYYTEKHHLVLHKVSFSESWIIISKEFSVWILKSKWFLTCQSQIIETKESFDQKIQIAFIVILKFLFYFKRQMTLIWNINLFLTSK